MATKDIDHGWKKIQKEIKGLKDAHVVVGVPSTTGPRKESGGPSMAEVAFWNEFGTKSSTGKVAIPERSFLRSSADENQKYYVELFRKLMRGVYAEKLTMKHALGLLGSEAQQHVQAKIRSGIEPENAEYTLKMKFPKTGTLRHTGQLIQSITYEVRGLKK